MNRFELAQEMDTALEKVEELKSRKDYKGIVEFIPNIQFDFDLVFLHRIHPMLQDAFYALSEVKGMDILESSRIIVDASRQMFEEMSNGTNSYQYLQFLIDFTDGHQLEDALKVITSLDPVYVLAWLRDITKNYFILMENMHRLSYRRADQVIQLFTVLTHSTMFFMKVERGILANDLAETKHFLEQCKTLKYFAKERYQHCFGFLISFVDIFAGNIDDAEIERILDNIATIERKPKLDRFVVADIIITVAYVVDLLHQKLIESLNAQNAATYFAVLGGLAEKLPPITALDVFPAQEEENENFNKTFCGYCYNGVGAHALYNLTDAACNLFKFCIEKEIFDEAIVEDFNKIIQLNFRALSKLDCVSKNVFLDYCFDRFNLMAKSCATNEKVKYFIPILRKFLENHGQFVMDNGKHLYSKKYIVPLLLRFLIKETVPCYEEIISMAQSLADTEKGNRKEKWLKFIRWAKEKQTANVVLQ